MRRNTHRVAVEGFAVSVVQALVSVAQANLGSADKPHLIFVAREASKYLHSLAIGGNSIRIV